MDKQISISLQEYKELKHKAEAYDKLKAKQAQAGGLGGKKSSANMTPEQRRERAKKAVEARMKKYGQKARK